MNMYIISFAFCGKKTNILSITLLFFRIQNTITNHIHHAREYICSGSSSVIFVSFDIKYLSHVLHKPWAILLSTTS